MTQPASRAVLRGRARVTAGHNGGHAAALAAGPLWMRILPPVVMLAMGLWRITGNLVGTLLPAAVIRARLDHIRRLWLVESGPRPHPRLLHGLGFRLLRKWRPSKIWLLLYARSGQAARIR